MEKLETFQIAPNEPGSDEDIIDAIERIEDKLNSVVEWINKNEHKN